MSQISARPPRTEPVTHRSLGLSALTEQLRWDRKYNILDLGPALGLNIVFFSEFTAKVYIEDLYRSLAASGAFASEEAEAGESIFEGVLDYATDTRFDIILSWDLFNYLRHDQLARLVHHLTRFCKPGTLLFALISSLREIPDQPTSFKILDRENLIYETRSPGVRPCPQYSPYDLNKIMAGFDASNSFLLRHGIREYLFAYEGSPAGNSKSNVRVTR